MANLQSIRTRHTELYDEFSRNAERLRSDTFRPDLEQFLEELAEAAAHVERVEDYLWLRDTVERWRSAGPALGMTVDLVLQPPDKLHRDALAGQLPKETRLDDWLKNRSHEFFRERAVSWYNSRSVDDVVALYLEKIGQGEAAQGEADDWARAELHLAAEVIEGKIDLVRDMDPESYWRIEGRDGGMWFERVVALKAYFRWQRRGRGWGAEQATSDYLEAHAELHAMMQDARRKAPKIAFEPIAAYLNQRYLTAEGKLAIAVAGKYAEAWLNTKAQKLAVADKAYGPYSGPREAAEQMMEGYYENIARAVLESDPIAADSVWNALGVAPGHAYNESIVNCFEMAVAVYFLDFPAQAQI